MAIWSLILTRRVSEAEKRVYLDYASGWFFADNEKTDDQAALQRPDGVTADIRESRSSRQIKRGCRRAWARQ